MNMDAEGRVRTWILGLVGTVLSGLLVVATLGVVSTCSGHASDDALKAEIKARVEADVKLT